MAANRPDTDVSGMLLYARTSNALQPNDRFRMEGNVIYVQTLDLSLDFADIESQLGSIAELVEGEPYPTISKGENQSAM